MRKYIIQEKKRQANGKTIVFNPIDKNAVIEDIGGAAKVQKAFNLNNADTLAFQKIA